MKRRPRRNHIPAFKAKVAIAAIKGDRTIVQLAEQFDVHRPPPAGWGSVRSAAKTFASPIPIGGPPPRFLRRDA